MERLNLRFLQSRHFAANHFQHICSSGYCLLVAERPSSRLVYLRDRSAQTILRAATLEIEVADPTFYLTQSQYTDTRPTSPSADPVTLGAWQGSHWYDSTPKKSRYKRDSNLGPCALEADALTTRPTRRSQVAKVQLCANHMQHKRLSLATCHVPHGMKGQVSYYVSQSWNHIYFSFILLAEISNRWRRGGNRSTWRKPLTTSFIN